MVGASERKAVRTGGGSLFYRHKMLFDEVLSFWLVDIIGLLNQ